MGKKIIIGVVCVSILIVIGFALFYFSKDSYSDIVEDEGMVDGGEISQANNSNGNLDNNENSFADALTNLALPFDTEDMGGGNEFVTPFGLIRHERDRGHGHAGIDVPLSKGDEIYAVANGKIIKNNPAIDGGEGNNFEGNNVVLLIAEGERVGEGWGFLYEHIILSFGINVDSVVSKGQLIGASALTNGNNHLGLVYYFNDFNYVKEPKCWVEHLNEEDKQRLLVKWEEISSSDGFLSSWRDSFEDGFYPYRALLDLGDFPNGPELCYEYGLDVRQR